MADMTISLDYERVMEEARRLKSVSSELQGMQMSAQNALSGMSAYWQGDAATAFTEVNANWRREMKSIETEVLAIAQAIEKIAAEVKEAEERAKAAIASFGTGAGDAALGALASLLKK